MARSFIHSGNWESSELDDISSTVPLAGGRSVPAITDATPSEF